MSQDIADAIKNDFEALTGVGVAATFLRRGATHRPTTLPDGMCGVYAFMGENCCFKVGKAGPNSKARWNSHHYNLDESTPSTLPKSIVRNKDRVKREFPVEVHPTIDALDKSAIQNWIRNNTCRIEFLIYDNGDKSSLNLLEALAQYRLKPIFEGKKAGLL
jgi:hypothetical protein